MGPRPIEHDPKNRDSYFVTLENDKGQQHTIWGVDLERAMKEAAPEIGDKIGLEHRDRRRSAFRTADGRAQFVEGAGRRRAGL
jgi:hypothetical protein